VILNDVPLYVIALGFAVLIFACGEVGFHIGKRMKTTLGESPFGVLQAAIFGLLALLLGFSFSLGLSRYDARRAEVLEEANSIDTAMHRARLLDEQTGAAMDRYLQQYVEARIAFALAGTGGNEAERGAALEASGRLQAQMYDLAVTAANRDKHSTTVPLVVSALDAMTDQSKEEEAILAAHVPDAVVLLLAVVIAFASVLLGVGFGRTERRGAVAIASFAIVLALVVEGILDLDRPQRGFIRVSLAPLQELRQNVTVPR
jgi:hypothetical protein